MATPSEPAASEDRFLDGRVALRQRAEGYRAGADAVLLAAAAAFDAQAGGRFVEGGCGAGAALLCAATLAPGASFVGIERDAEAAGFARGNVQRAGFEERVAVVEADLFVQPWPAVAAGSFDGAFVNPPFDEAAHPGLHPGRLASHVTERPIGDWVLAFANRLTGSAALTMIHRADRLAEILAALQGRLGGIVVAPIRPRADAAASRVLVRAVKGSRAPLKLLGGLDLHAADGRFTPEADAIFRGERLIGLR